MVELWMRKRNGGWRWEWYGGYERIWETRGMTFVVFETGLFCSRPNRKPYLLPLGRPNPDPYPSTHRFSRVWLDLSVAISGSAFRVFLIMVAFWYLTVHCKILTMVQHSHFLMYWQPLYREQVERRSLPHPGNEHQQSVNNWLSCIVGNLSGA